MTDAVRVAPDPPALLRQLKHGEYPLREKVVSRLTFRCPECGKLSPNVWSDLDGADALIQSWSLICGECLRELREALAGAS